MRIHWGFYYFFAKIDPFDLGMRQVVFLKLYQKNWGINIHENSIHQLKKGYHPGARVLTHTHVSIEIDLLQSSSGKSVFFLNGRIFMSEKEWPSEAFWSWRNESPTYLSCWSRSRSYWFYWFYTYFLATFGESQHDFWEKLLLDTVSGVARIGFIGEELAKSLGGLAFSVRKDSSRKLTLISSWAIGKIMWWFPSMVPHGWMVYFMENPKPKGAFRGILHYEIHLVRNPL